ncbi:MAG: hypothetical protein MI924_27135 [Chloroflexales bacterium]|nr:hypothetical protein [Chloroflexales bacterium]
MVVHPHHRAIIASIQRFRNQESGTAGLQRDIAAIQGAIEGDMPGAREIRKALEEAENSIEYIWHTKDKHIAMEGIHRILDELEVLVEHYAR